MPRFEITAPDGNRYEINAPEGATEQQALEYFKSSYQQPKELGITDRVHQFAGGFNRTLGGPVDAVSWLLNKLGVETGPAPVGGSQWMQNTFGKAPEATDTAGRVLDYTGGMVGASVLPYAAVAGAARAAPMVSASSRAPSIISDMVNAAKTNPGAYASSELTNATLAGLGGATAREIAPGSLTAELVGQLAPGVAMNAPGMVKKAIQGGEAGRQNIRAAIDDFNAAGASPSVGQATGKYSQQGLETMLGASPGGVSQMRKAAQRTADQLAAKVTSTANAYGSAVNEEQAGRAVQQGIKGFVQRFQEKSSQMYGALDRYLKPDARVDVTNTTNALQRLTQPINGAENLSAELSNPKINRITEAFTADAVDGQIPYRALKELRSTIGRMLSDSELISEAPRSQLKQVYAALSDDMTQAAAAQGDDALRAFDRANNYYRSGLSRIENQLQRLSDKVNPEHVFRALEKGDITTLRSVRRSLTPDEWGDVSSVMLREMGKARPGVQDATGNAFSVESFLTNWAKLDETARNTFFAGARYKTMDRDLNAIARAASRVREGSRVLANPSGTAGQAANIAAGTAAVTQALQGDVVTPTIIGLYAVGNNAAARLMTSPKFVRWLATTTNLNTEQLPGYIGRLTTLLRDEDEDTKAAAAEYLNTLGDP